MGAFIGKKCFSCLGKGVVVCDCDGFKRIKCNGFNFDCQAGLNYRCPQCLGYKYEDVRKRLTRKSDDGNFNITKSSTSRNKSKICSVCQGTGTVKPYNCKYCDGKGYSECTECDDMGMVKCQICNGYGCVCRFLCCGRSSIRYSRL